MMYEPRENGMDNTRSFVPISKGTMISHYKIIEKIGAGGMGEVYLAEDTELNRKVALKFLPPHLCQDEGCRARFKREAQAAAMLEHPNIITIHEVGEHQSRAFIVMQYVEGQLLRNLMKGKELSPDRIIDLAIQICEGLSKAHQAGIIHRDIKPSNIVIDADDRPKLLDFGLAAVQGSEHLTKAGSTLGTIGYMSPEQIQVKKVDQHSDLFSFGIVLYEMITGRVPFKGETEVATLNSVLNDTPEPLLRYKSDVSCELQRIVSKLLEKDTELRYQSAAEVISDLKKLKIDLKSEISKSQPIVSKPQPSIAVLPFIDMSAKKDQEYFCYGIAEEIINALTHVENLRVVARTSAFSFKGKDVDIREIGRKLNVSTLLEGSVRKARNRLRITAQLINVDDGYHLWSERFDREMEDIFAIQDEISLSVVDNLKVKLLGGEKTKLVKRFTVDPEVYKLYLMGVYNHRKGSESNVLKAIEYLDRAIEKLPNYARAYALKSNCYFAQGWLGFVPPENAFQLARSTAIKAIELDPELGEGHGALGIIKAYYDWDWAGAEKEFEKMIELSPSFASGYTEYASYFMLVGNNEKAVELGKKALELDPLNTLINFYLGIFLIRSGKYREAEEHLLTTIEIDPNYVMAHWMLGHIYVLEGKYNDGLKIIQKAVDNSKNNDIILGGLGWAYAVSGREKEAEKIIDKLKSKAKREYVRPYMFAKIYAALEKKDLAFEWLDKAYDKHDISLCFIYSDETVDNLRSDSRYEELLRKLKLKI